MSRWSVVLALLLLAVACSSTPGGSAPPAPSTSESSSATPVVHRLRGELIQRGAIMECDLPGGDPIVIFDENGDIVATGEVGSPGGWSWGGGGPGPGWHVSHFVVEDVPERTFYTIESGDLVNQSFSFAELADADWTVELEVPCGLRGR